MDDDSDINTEGSQIVPSCSLNSRVYIPSIDRRNRSCTTSNSSNNDQDKKPSTEIIDRKSAYFPDKYVNLSTHWYLYRIDIPGDNALGFIVPYELLKLPKFYLYTNDEALEVQVLFLGPIDYEECGRRLECFCQYLFEEVFDGMHTGPDSILKFDMKHSTFKLLPCLLKQESGELDYQRMISICDRKNRLTQELSELNDQEVYIRLKSPGKQFFISVTDPVLLQQTSGLRRNSSMVSIKRIENPSMDYLKQSASPTNKKQKILSLQPEHYSIKSLRYATLNKKDFELIYKLPSILERISRLYYIKQLRQFVATNIQSQLLLNDDRMSAVTFCDCLPQLFSSNQSATLPLIPLNYNLLSEYNSRLPLPLDLLFRSITGSSAAENTNMKSLATLGDGFLNLAVTLSLYHQYPSYNIGELTDARSKQVSNDNLYRIATEKGLKRYLNATKIIFCGKNANWLPPGYTIDKENSERYLEQKVEPKVFADMIEALIGAFLVSTNYSTTLKFMDWLGLDVIPTDKHGMIELPSILRNNESSHMNGIKNAIDEHYYKHSFVDIENKINYAFADKAYLIAAFTHPSCSRSANTINYKKLKFVGNALMEFLSRRYTFITAKSVTPGHISNVQQDLLTNDSKAAIMVANGLHSKLICTSLKSKNLVFSNTANKDVSTDEKNVTQRADVPEALIGAVFFDSSYSLSVVWNVITCLVRQHKDLDTVVKNPNLNPVRLVHESGGIITEESPDDNGNFVYQVKLPDGTKIEGSGKSKRSAQQSACKKIKK